VLLIRYIIVRVCFVFVLKFLVIFESVNLFNAIRDSRSLSARLRYISKSSLRAQQYDIRYRELYSIGIPEYSRKQSQKDFQKIIARFRYENEELPE